MGLPTDTPPAEEVMKNVQGTVKAMEEDSGSESDDKMPQVLQDLSQQLLEAKAGERDANEKALRMEEDDRKRKERDMAVSSKLQNNQIKVRHQNGLKHQPMLPTDNTTHNLHCPS